ncbi:MAG TPA: hypothetical protein PLG43_10640 [Spirochaetia bacterium]|jgi:hypothetical protein|nr:hypothetical protein [Spirochaetia bacterium]
MSINNVIDLVSDTKGDRFVEAVLVRGKAFSIRHLENGSVYREERFISETKAKERWAAVKTEYSKNGGPR